MEMKLNFKAKNLKQYHIKTHSEEWFKFRTTGLNDFAGGIGSSEAGKMLGLSPYRPTIMEMFHQKVGTLAIEQIDNRFMFFGRQMEPYVKDLWQMYDGEGEGYIENWKRWEAGGKQDKDLIRKAGDVGGCYLVNPDYPYLFGSLDARIMAGEPLLIDGEPRDFDVPLEIKTISFFAAKKWENRIPPAYLAQVNLQMLITDSDQAEICALQDGNDLFVLPVARNEDICRELVSQSTSFFEDRVLPGRELLKERNSALAAGNNSLAEQLLAEISSLEPEPDGSDAVKEFYSESFTKEREKVEGTMTDYDLAQKYKSLNAYIRFLTNKKKLVGNQLTKIFVDNNVEYLDFSDGGYCRYFRKQGQANYQLNVTTKSKLDETAMVKEIEKLNIDLDI